MADTTALGVAKLHGYTLDDVHVSRRDGFRCVPPHSGMRTFIFAADNEYDKKRWVPIVNITTEMMLAGINIFWPDSELINSMEGEKHIYLQKHQLYYY